MRSAGTWATGAALIAAFGPVHAQTATAGLADLGRVLFFDANLSAERNQSCSTCHDPGRAFTDARDNGVNGAVSLGDDGKSLGDRNTPALTYASIRPDFSYDADGHETGGFFLDGRAATMVEQAQQPILNPIEMALPDARTVLQRLKENDSYAGLFRQLMGDSALASPGSALQSVAEAIVAFEKTEEFATFDSRYDRYLRGEVNFTKEEELGRALFFSELINCNLCHLLDTREAVPGELFTNHRYHNIGIPVNQRVRALNGIDVEQIDEGLLQNPRVDDPNAAGKFRVPSLRNVAVTGPYMHNGVFRELETAIVFYNQFILRDDASRINPEDGKPWGPIPVSETVDLELLREGQPLTERRVSLLVAFLKTLTDQRYEHLLD